MNRIMKAMLIMLIVTSFGCWSASSVKEMYTKTPVEAESVGEGKSSFTFEYNGQVYQAFRAEDGKYRAILEPKEPEPKKVEPKKANCPIIGM